MPASTRWRRRLRAAVVAIGLTAMIVGALLGLVRLGLMTAPGRRLIEAELNGLSLGTFGKLQVEGLSGDFAQDFTIRRLTISDKAGVWLDATDAHVTWSYWKLLRRQVDIDQVTVARIDVLRRPILAASSGGGRLPVSIHIGALSARLATAPAFSYRAGLFDVSGAYDQAKAGAVSGRLAAVSLTHAGDRLDGTFDFGRNKSVALNIQAHEAQGGPLAGALGLAANAPFLLAVSATGTTSQGRFQVASRSGTVTPAEAIGGWTPQGGAATGHIVLAASRLLAGYQTRLGPEARFAVDGVKAVDGFDALTLSINSANVQLVAKGEADIARRRIGPRGLAVTLAASPAARLLSWPEMGRTNFSGLLAGAADRWSLAGDLAIETPSALGYRLGRAHGPAHLAWQAGELTLGLTLDGEGGSGSGVAAALLGARPHGAAELTWLRDGRLMMTSLELAGPGLKLTGAGQRGLLGDLTFKGQGNFANFAAARPGAKGALTASWTASQGRGAEAPWKLSVDAGATGFASGIADLDHLLGPTPRFKGQASLDARGLEVSSADLTGAAGDVAASGPIGMDGAMNLKVDWRAKGPIEVGPLEIAGAAKGGGSLTGTPAAPKVELVADFDSIDLPSLPLTQAHATLSLQKGPNDTDGAFTLAASSAYGPAKAASNFRFMSDGLSLSGLDAQAGGAHVAGAISLSRGAPSSADLTVAMGPGAFLSRGEADGRLQIVDAPGGPRATLKASANNADLNLAGLIVQTGSISASGPLSGMGYQLQAQGLTTHGGWKAAGGGTLVATGDSPGATFQGGGRVRNADFKTLAPAQLRFGPGGRSLSLLAEVGGGQAQIEARQSGDAFQAKAQLTGVSVALVDQDFTGQFDASLNLSGQGARLGGDLEARLTDAGERGAKSSPAVDGVIKAVLAQDALTVDAQLGNAQGLISHAHLVLPAEATAAPFRIALVRTRPISGDFSAQGEVRPLWDLLMGTGRGLAGQVNARGTLGGTLAEPRIEGEGSLANGQFTDADSGLKLRGVTLSGRLADNVLSITQFAGGDASSGTISGSGQISLERAGASSFKLDLKGFRLIDNDIATAVATGQTTISRAADGRVNVAGNLNIDRADVAANPPVPSGVTPMDVVEINRPSGQGGHLQAEATHAAAVELDVTLKAPGRVYLKGRGLNAELSLDAHVGGTTAATDLSGVARVVRGDYDFAGKRFEFDNQGVVYLASSTENIRLDLTATRDDPTLTAVIRIEGTAARPKITLSSTPVLPNDEVLSQVLFGASASQLSAGEAAELASALSEMAGGGGFDILGNLRTFAHLDRLALGGGASNSDVSVSGGKYVTDNIYLELTGGGREGPSAQVEWRVRRSLSVISTIAGAGGDSQVSVRWRKDF